MQRYLEHGIKKIFVGLAIPIAIGTLIDTDKKAKAILPRITQIDTDNYEQDREIIRIHENIRQG